MPEYQGVIEYEREITAAERFFARSPFAIVAIVARIRGTVSEEMLRSAVTKIQQRHALLRVRIETRADHAPWFTSQGVQEIPITVVPRESENDWIETHARASRVPFEFETRPAIRFVLVQAPDVSELLILCHHIICDGMSLAYLARDLMVCLGEPEREVEVLPAPKPIDLDNLPDDVSQPRLVKFLIGRMNRKWAQEAVFFDQEDYEILTKAYWDHYHHDLLSIELSEAETTALVARCRQEKVTVNTALTAAFSGAQSFVQGEQPYHAKTVIAADLRDRLPHSPGEGMGMYA
ncbi:MAG: condensation domain-containing protein, partial [Anaerolineae bacterium]